MTIQTKKYSHLLLILLVSTCLFAAGCGAEEYETEDYYGGGSVKIGKADTHEDGGSSGSDAFESDAVESDAVESDAVESDAVESDTNEEEKAIILSFGNHSGYGEQVCEDCHDTPVANHTETEQGLCAKCHGGNGACTPNGPNSRRQSHKITTKCTMCHKGAKGHGYTDKKSCISCHYAEAGTEDCP